MYNQKPSKRIEEILQNSMSGLTLKNEAGEIESLEYVVTAILSYLDEIYEADRIKQEG